MRSKLRNEMPAAYHKYKDILTDIYKKLYAFYGPQGWWPAKTPLEVITGAILTQNTAWRNVEKAIKNLKKAGLLSDPSRIKRARTRTLAALIRCSGYYNIKALRLKNFIDFLFSVYSGDLSAMSRQDTPRLRGELLSINGIGPETCDSILLYAFKKPVFVVDAYTKRVLERHRLSKRGAGYDAIQRLFMDNMPRAYKLYNEYHALIVRLGKDFCKTRPDCVTCPVNMRKISCK